MNQGSIYDYDVVEYAYLKVIAMSFGAPPLGKAGVREKASTNWLMRFIASADLPGHVSSNRRMKVSIDEVLR